MNNGLIDTYTVIDVETPNRKNDSICSIALVRVEYDQIVSKEHYLVNPEDSFDDLNIKIHHITQRMVSSEPHFLTIWEKISHHFTNGIVVAHNASFDLSVISKSLSKYEVNVPDFFYFCTMNLSKSVYTDNRKFGLDDLCLYLGIDLENHHNALCDVAACHELFAKIKSKVMITKSDVETFHLSNDYKEKIPHQIITKSLNIFYGLIHGIDADQKINQIEINTIRQWIGENSKFSKVHPFNIILKKTINVLEDNIITTEEKCILLEETKKYLSSEAFSQSTLSFQILMGILEGISCDKLINFEELIELQKWLAHNSHLKGCYPYDAIIKILEDVLADGVITESENKVLLDLFNDFTNPTDTKSDGTISLADKIVCLTGEFTYGSKADVAEIIDKLGGEIAGGVTSKINVLVVGGEGSDNWSFGNYGTKVKKALELNSKGKNIQIIGENAFLEIIKR